MFASAPDHREQGIPDDSAELSSWDFLQDLDFVSEPDSVLAAVPKSTATALSSSLSAREKNRIAQQKFRKKKASAVQVLLAVLRLPVFIRLLCLQKERDQTIEAQLAETTSELHNLRLKQKELEARNSLLEKVAALSRQQSLQPDTPSNAKSENGGLNRRQVCCWVGVSRHTASRPITDACTNS